MITEEPVILKTEDQIRTDLREMFIFTKNPPPSDELVEMLMDYTTRLAKTASVKVIQNYNLLLQAENN